MSNLNCKLDDETNYQTADWLPSGVWNNINDDDDE